MGVTFIIGRAGSGKTARCFQRIQQMLRDQPLGPAIFLIVPNQATFQVEREMMAATGGFSRLSVVSFDLLGRQIALECGDAAVPELTPLGRQLILGHLLRRHRAQLRFFGSVAHQPGMAAELDATFAELERSGKTSADLARLIEALGRSDPDDAHRPWLGAKLRDLRFLYDAYQNYLGQDRLDQHRRLTQAVEQLQDCAMLRNATIFVDDFYSFTEYERRFLAGLGRTCAAVEINLNIDPGSPTVCNPEGKLDEMGLFHRTERAYCQLRTAMEDAKVQVRDLITLDAVYRYQSPDLRAIEREALSAIFATAEKAETGIARGQSENASQVNNASGSGASDTGLRLVEAPDLRAEVDAVARGIVDLLREGYRLRDVAVLARDLGSYQQLIDTSFPEHGLAGVSGPSYYFVDRRRSAEHHPLLAFLRAMFQIVMSRWSMPSVMSFLRTGLTGVSLREADEIENYLIQHRLEGSAWDDPAEWAYQREITAPGVGEPPLEVFDVRDVQAMRLVVVAGLKPLIDKLGASGPFPVRDIAVEVFGACERFNVRDKLSEWANGAIEAGRPEEGAEHEQVWAETVDLFEQMVDLIGEETTKLGDFVDILEWGLERFTLALTPPTVDQVLVGQVGRTRTPEVKAVFLLGMNEGQFPRAGRDETILSRWERRELTRYNLELDPGSDRQRLDEHFLGYVALTRASQLLIVSRPMSDEAGRPTHPSVFWRRLADLLPAVGPVQVPREAQAPRDIGRIATPRQLVGSLMQWAREEVSEAVPQVCADSGASPESRLPRSRPLLAPSPGVPVGDVIAEDPRAALYQWLATSNRLDSVDAAGGPPDYLKVVVAGAWRALSYSNDARLSEPIARELFPTPLRAAVAQMETFAVCPFRHFVRYGLRLTGREDPRVTGLDMSQLFHRVLRYMGAALLERGLDWSELSAEEATEMIRSFSASVARDVRGELMLSSARNKYLLSRIERTLGLVARSLREMQARGGFRPIHADVGYGQGGKLPAYQVQTPTGAELQLSGRIDRIDALNAGMSGDAAVVAYDYKLSAGALSFVQVLHGLSLQLLSSLMVLRSQGESIVGKPLTPAGAFYLPLLRGIRWVSHPSEALEASDPLLALLHTPRGVFDSRFFHDLDDTGELGAASHVVQAYVNNDGQLGKPASSDFVAADEMNALLDFVHLKLGEIGDEIFSGRIDITPYRIGKVTPCPRCEYRAICRFEPGPGSYNHLRQMPRQDALVAIATRVNGRGDGT
jgi:ATP-dependent helicase/nuclease subunit B